MKNEKGSLALFVTIAMLFFMSFLLVLYIATTNEQKTQLEVTARIKETYEKNVNDSALETIYSDFFGNDEYIPIYTGEQLKKVGSGEIVYIEEIGKYYTFDLSSNYILKNNIELNKNNYTVSSDGTVSFNSDAEQWNPIGSSTEQFLGIFDGNNYTITGLYINVTNGYQGLFAYNNGTIQNVIIDEGMITAGNCVGAIVGQNDENGNIVNCVNKININGGGAVSGIIGKNSGKISNCTNEGNITNTGYDIGGICGQLINLNASVENCTNKGKITGKKGVGGIVGYIQYGGTIENCSNQGEVFSDDTERSDVGGIAGIIGGTSSVLINKCYNSGNLSGEIYVGGINGRTTNENTTISNCYNSGNVISNRTVADDSGDYISKTGGILGCAGSNVTIKQCYNIGDVEANGINVGGILGYATGSTITNCYYLTDTATGGINGTDEEGKAEAKTSDEMKTNEFNTLLNNGESNWKIVDSLNNGYPILSWQR